MEEDRGAALFPGWEARRVATSGGASIFLRHGGSGPPLLLMHGNPQSHVIWHPVAPKLAERFHVIAIDLRGYGDSDGPGDLSQPVYDAADYTFRKMAQDAVDVMASFGHARFLVCGHDRGARVTHRLCLDHPEAVERAALLDILPQRHLWANVNAKWAMKSWHWVFMPQGDGLPEAMMEGVDPEFFMRRKIGKPGVGIGIFDPRAYAEYVRCFTPRTIRASCADYRATATLDLEMDEADYVAGKRIACPALVLWGAGSHTKAVFDEPLRVWRDYAADLRGAGVAAGHYLVEQAPEEVLSHLLPFLSG
ncbi:alpha/beta fold hydrolase [Muricoccus radiodurans]|uniref:alpha/beta fold hydrolase n=1 Tax=Muricoccus radiodurans TaxID=2231721 RepID=UPI003CF4DACA